MNRRALALVPILFSFTLAASADTTQEIDHLLGFIGGSSCIFIRNGKEHDATTARSHIERKYEYAQKWIETTEQFIEYTATRSSISGEPYWVICSGRKEPSADWMKRELARFRAASGK